MCIRDRYTISVPLSPITLVRPESPYADVSTSIFEIRLQVEKGSRVVIDGTNVSDQVNNNGVVSSNVQVQPTGENRIQVSVRSKYCRENNMEIVLNRPQQDIALEFAADTLEMCIRDRDNTGKRPACAFAGCAAYRPCKSRRPA